jgi:hypothetical protein
LQLSFYASFLLGNYSFALVCVLAPFKARLSIPRDFCPTIFAFCFGFICPDFNSASAVWAVYEFRFRADEVIDAWTRAYHVGQTIITIVIKYKNFDPNVDVESCMHACMHPNAKIMKK